MHRRRHADKSQWVLCLAYEGAAFHGVAPQPGRRTVAAALLQRLQGLGERPPWALSFAARTDAGVGAEANLATVRLGACPDVAAWRAAMLRPRPDGLQVRAAGHLPRPALARGMAASKHYRYSWPQRPDLDAAAMQRAAAHCLGTHDFAALRDAGCQARQTTKTLVHLRVGRDGDEVRLDVHGSGFLRKMVRIFAGTLQEVGEGKRSPDSLVALLLARQRSAAGPTAAAAPLRLMGVTCVPCWQADVQAALAPHPC